MKVYELLDTPEKWTQGAIARDHAGNDLEDLDGENDQRAACWCLEGAIFRCYGFGRGFQMIDDVAAHLPIAPYKWNDTEGRTYEDVIALAKELDI